MKTFDFYGYNVQVEGSIEGVFEKEYGAFLSQRAPTEVQLKFVEADFANHRFHDPQFPVLPFSIQIDPEEPIVRYRAGASPDRLTNILETLLRWNDRVLVHGASVSRDGKGILLAAPDDTGKTNTVLHLVRQGYGLLSDDWSMVSQDGTIWPFLKPIHVFDYNLAANPHLQTAIGQSIGGKLYTKAYSRARFRLLKTLPKAPRRVVEWATPQPMWHLQPEELGGTRGSPAQLSRVIWMQRHYGREFDYMQLTRDDLISRILGHARYERGYFRQVFARLNTFGQARWSEYLEETARQYREVLGAAFKSFPSVTEVRIPDAAKPEEVITAVEKAIE